MTLSVYVLIPSALKEHTSRIFRMWFERGYRIGLFVEPAADISADMVIRSSYPGVWKAWNALSRAAIACGADVCILAGDDMEPDPNCSAQEIGHHYLDQYPHGDGIVQPCGDPQGRDDSGTPAAARICGSPIMGREWIKRAYQGNGPVDGRYNAFYADEALWHVASNMGKLCLEPKLSHFHRHWSWGHLPRQKYHERNQQHWLEDKKLFEQDLAAGFPNGAFLI